MACCKGLNLLNGLSLRLHVNVVLSLTALRLIGMFGEIAGIFVIHSSCNSSV